MQQQAERQARRAIWRENTFSIFNISMLGLAAVQWLLSDPWGALLTLGVMALNIGWNVFQQRYSSRRIRELQALAQPLATVIRDGKLRSIELSDIVIDDVLVIGSGDQIPADGELLDGANVVLEETIWAEVSSQSTKQQGDSVSAGSYCVHGRAAYRVTVLPLTENSTASSSIVSGSGKTLMPIQRIIDRILRIMLVAIALFLLLLLVEIFTAELMPPELKSIELFLNKKG